MNTNNAPMKGHNRVADALDSNANHEITQSRVAQSKRILQWLMAHKRLTTLEARNILGIMHPASRIQHLREAGYAIETHWQRNTDATGKRHKQGLYVLTSPIGGAK